MVGYIFQNIYKTEYNPSEMARFIKMLQSELQCVYYGYCKGSLSETSAPPAT